VDISGLLGRAVGEGRGSSLAPERAPALVPVPRALAGRLGLAGGEGPCDGIRPGKMFCEKQARMGNSFT